jgi:hypothetical protein
LQKTAEDAFSGTLTWRDMIQTIQLKVAPVTLGGEPPEPNEEDLEYDENADHEDSL